VSGSREKRKLAAILAADVVGFSRLMEADEAGTLARLKAARAEIIDPAVTGRDGRIVKSTGDGILAEFSSAVDAVTCAVEIQGALAQSGNAKAENTRLQIRIGINLGDVIVDGDDIFGDGVNVAARLEGLAAPGGVAISQSVHGMLTGALAAGFADTGEHAVKNISRPVRVWTWSERPHAAARPAAASGKKPVLAILPFARVGDDPDIQTLADGIAEDVTTAFSNRTGVEVVGRQMTAGLDAKASEFQEMRKALGIDYVLSGSVRASGPRLRVTAELIECDGGVQVWTNRYDRELGDVFAIQDQLTERIAMSVRWAMNAYEGRRLAERPEASLSDADRRAKAAEHFYRFTADDFRAAMRHLDAVLQHNPDDAMALSMRAFSIAIAPYYGVTPASADEVAGATEMAERSVQLAKTSDYSFVIRSMVALHLRADHANAIDDARIALELSPQYAIGLTALGEALAYAGRPDEGIPLMRRTIEADSRDPTNYPRQWMLAMGLFGAADYAGALQAIERAMRGTNEMPVMDLAKAAILVQLDRTEDAKRVIDALRSRFPSATLATVHQPLFKNADDRERYLDALREAGLPKA